MNYFIIIMKRGLSSAEISMTVYTQTINQSWARLWSWYWDWDLGGLCLKPWDHLFKVSLYFNSWEQSEESQSQTMIPSTKVLVSHTTFLAASSSSMNHKFTYRQTHRQTHIQTLSSVCLQWVPPLPLGNILTTNWGKLNNKTSYVIKLQLKSSDAVWCHMMTSL